MSSNFLSENKLLCTLANGYKMAYVEIGPTDPEYSMIFLHGNPTSSYLWRNIMPQFSDMYHTLAVDLIGMGDSDKLTESGDGTYTFPRHADFLDEFLESCVDLKDNVVFVIHDWGSALGFHWSFRNQEKVKGLAFFEAFLDTVQNDNVSQEIVDFITFFGTDEAEVAVLQQNMFVEQILPQSIMRNLTQEEMDTYRAPYLEAGESRRVTLDWPRQIPLNGEPKESFDMVTAYHQWLETSTTLPKLLILGEPGSLNVAIDEAKTWPMTTVTSVPGFHFLQEDSPDEIASAVNDWMEASVLPNTMAMNETETSGAPVGFGYGVIAIWMAYRVIKSIFYIEVV